MNFLKSIVFVLVLVSGARAQNDFTVISLRDFSAFREPGKNWQIAGDAVADFNKQHDLRAVKGEGVLINNFSRNNQMHLYTKEEFGDLELELEFMMAKNSNSGIYLQGRYEIQLLDCWMKTNPSSSDAGAVYMRWTPEKEGFEGTPPIMNAAKAPGLWQHLYIRFRAPRFNEKGEKIKNARFELVRLNGAIVQQEVEVTGGTASNMYPNAPEVAKAPLVIQGDHGPVAFRNIRYRTVIPPYQKPEGDLYWIPGSDYWNTLDPMIVNAEGKPKFIKTFQMYGDKKLTHIISVGHPNEVNYSYDLKQGEIFQIWRGKFLDLTPAWRDRGGMQISTPLGAVKTLNNEPPVAHLENENAAWPSSVDFDSLNNKGYVLDKERSPTFSYSVFGLNIADHIRTVNEGLVRTITVENPTGGTYCRLARAEKIEKIAADLYAVDDKSYYLRVDKKYKAVLRQSVGKSELIVKYNSPVTYALIW